MEYKCSICGEEFDNLTALINHLREYQMEQDMREDMNYDLDAIKESISSLKEEIDDFNKTYSNFMKITYDFTFTEIDNAKEPHCDCCASASKNECKSEDENEEKEFAKLLDDFVKNLNVKVKVNKPKEAPEMDFIDFLSKLFNEED
jgi:hypothetical protein